LADYFKRKSPVWAGIENRIVFLNGNSGSSAVRLKGSLPLAMLALLYAVVILVK